MRILHLSTSTLGGAGVIASRIAEIQVAKGHIASVLSINNEGNKNALLISRTPWKKFLMRLNTMISILDSRKPWEQLTSSSVGGDIMPVIESVKPDIIHIHNWFNLLSLAQIEHLLSRYICVFHIHDARWMTGGCHFTINCNQYLNGCRKCPATITKKKFVQRAFSETERLFLNADKYGVIFPSKWLMNNFRSSSISKHSTINSYITNPQEKIQSNSIAITKKDGIVCVISDLSATVKGFDLFLHAVSELRISGYNQSIKVVGANATHAQLSLASNLGIEMLGRKTNIETVEIIQNSQLLVVPSLSENAPTVILEAQSSRTCVLATRIPGNLELIHEGKTGLICEPTAEGIFAGISAFLRSDNIESIIQKAFEVSSVRNEGVIEEIENVYKVLMSSESMKNK